MKSLLAGGSRRTHPSEEGSDVDPCVAQLVELDGLPGDDQEGGIGSVIADHAAEVDQQAAEIGAGNLVAPLRPQHPRQLFPWMGALCLHSQVGQQGSCLVGFKARDNLAVQGHAKTAE